MRNRLSDGHPEAPLLIYVGRIGTEKKIYRLKKVLDANPGARLAFVGKGPIEEDMKKLFAGYPVHFVGQLIGMPTLTLALTLI
jgi:glycosyltransferase involved in cell wall biosynthesis